MNSKKNNMEDSIASSMSNLLDDESYTKIFSKLPMKQVKTASQKVDTKGDLIKNAFSSLMKASQVFDEIGLHNSAESILIVVSEMLDETKNVMTEDVMTEDVMTEEELAKAALQAVEEEIVVSE
jgi:hypothetical protein